MLSLVGKISFEMVYDRCWDMFDVTFLVSQSEDPTPRLARSYSDWSWLTT